MIDAFTADPDVDMVIGAYNEKQHAFWPNWGSRVSRWLGHKLFRRDSRLRFSSFRMVRTLTVKSILNVQMERPCVGQLLLQMSNRAINVPVNHDPRKYGRSGYTLGRLIRDMVNNVMNNSALPLQWISYLGIASAASSFLLGGFYLYKYINIGVPVAGWTTLVLLMLFCFGILLLSVGIIGAYRIRIIKEGRKMPQYVIREKQTSDN